MVVTQKDQVVTGETAVFDTKTNLITMLGGVVLTQGKNVLRGDRLLVDMTTGVSRVESDSRRVQGLFQSSGQGGPAIPGDGQPGPTPLSSEWLKQTEIRSITYMNPGAARLKAGVRACIYRASWRIARRGTVRASNRGVFRWARTSIPSCCARRINSPRRLRITVKG